MLLYIKSIFTSVFAFLGKALGDGESPSASRLIAVPALLAINILPTLVWTGLSIYNVSLQEVPGSVVGYIGAINTALLIFLNRQKAQE